MKRALFLFLAILLLVSAAAFAQLQDVKVYVKSVPIIKIYSHSQGYKVLYAKSSMQLAEFYVPHSWFKAGGKAEIVFGKDPSYPYFSVFYKDGKFDYVRLYVEDNVSSLTWGILKKTGEEEAKFNVQELKLEF